MGKLFLTNSLGATIQQSWFYQEETLDVARARVRRTDYEHDIGAEINSSVGLSSWQRATNEHSLSSEIEERHRQGAKGQNKWMIYFLPAP